MRAELEALWLLERLHAEHKDTLHEEKECSDNERKFMESWIHDLKEGFRVERQYLEGALSS